MRIRVALALLVIVPAAMAYPWHGTTDSWILGVAIAVVLVVFAWWRGLFVTTMLARRIAVWRRNHGAPTPQSSNHVTVVLRVEAPEGAPLPVSTIAGYVDRFGILCDAVRITSRDGDGGRATWVGLTIGAEANLAALQARSGDIPLVDVAEVVGRRLAGHLREMGLDAAVVDTCDGPLAAPLRERWRAVEDERGSITAYAVAVDGRLGERLAEVWAHTSVETWTSLEFSGTSAHPTVTAVTAIRGDAAGADGLAGVVAIAGRQRPVLTNLDPRSLAPLGVDPAPSTEGLLDGIRWTVASANREVAEQTRL